MLTRKNIALQKYSKHLNLQNETLLRSFEAKIAFIWLYRHFYYYYLTK